MGKVVDEDAGVAGRRLGGPCGLYGPGVMTGDEAAAWLTALQRVINTFHLATGEQLSAVVDDAVHELGLSAETLLVDMSQRVFTPVHAGLGGQVEVVGTMAGRAYQLGEILPATDEQRRRLLWVPVLDGTDRVGVLRVGFDEQAGGADARLDGDLVLRDIVVDPGRIDGPYRHDEVGGPVFSG
jgi:hypothetical protein